MGACAEISGFVLAGGRSSRLGRDKALLPWPPGVSTEGYSQTLLQHAIVRLQCVCNTVLVCANSNDLAFGGTVIPDALPGSGPLGAIVAALEHSATDWNLLLAVDLPFLPVEVLQALVARACLGEQTGVASNPASPQPAACVFPEWDGLPQPLCGVYHRALAPGLRRALGAGKFKVMAALQEASDRVASNSETNPISRTFRIEMWDADACAAALQPALDPSEWFMNINTPGDWQRAQLRFK
jgi:molybdenum cofactor guanylyltransferase